ncbi:MAG: peptidase D-alanyl-D-alanine carboxypeptidase 1 [Verrucomicrobiales bacterium]|nr:peptidase D-alanyl-D-alanine carboxypeptidase 1 [Verrucomicrobiales bacterium]
MTPRSFLCLLLICATGPLFTGCSSLTGALPGGGGGPHGVANIGPVYPGIASYVVADANDGKVILSFQADQRRSVASLTKIATVVVVLDYLRNSKGNPDEMLTVPPSVLGLGVPSSLGLQPGDALSVRDAVYACMMGSDNWAAEALGTHFGGRLAQAGMGANPLQAFVNQMNGLRTRLQLTNTRFANPHGLDLPNASGYSCASDIARLFCHAITIPGFTYYSSQRERRISYVRNGATQSAVVRNTNEIIGTNRIDAGKTGTTNLAGPCLAVTAPKPATVIKRPDGSTLVIPHRLVVVTLGAQDRFGATVRLLRDGWTGYDAWRGAGSPAQNQSEFLGARPGSGGAAPAPSNPPPPVPAAPAPRPLPPPVMDADYMPLPPPVYAPASGGYTPVPRYVQ